jgi:hypothetical protein
MMSLNTAATPCGHRENVTLKTLVAIEASNGAGPPHGASRYTATEQQPEHER